jgi:phosphoribosylformylglycinamidine synthase
MKYKALISISPRKELLDPQGKAVKLGLKNLGIDSIEEARIGKLIELKIEAQSQELAEKMVQLACEKLLVNPIMESFSFTLEEN